MIIIRQSRKLILLGIIVPPGLCILGAGMAAGAWLGVFGRRSFPLFIYGLAFIAVGGILLFYLGPQFARLAKQFFAAPPTFIVDRNGVLDGEREDSAGRILWDDISRVEVVDFFGTPTVMIDVKDREALFARRPGGAAMKKSAAAQGGFPVRVYGELPMGASGLRDAILKYLKDPAARKELGEYSGPAS